MSVTAGRRHFAIKTFHKSGQSQLLETSTKRFMNTGLSVNLQEFDFYAFKGKQEQELIFSLKEVRINVFILYCDSFDANDLHLFVRCYGRC